MVCVVCYHLGWIGGAQSLTSYRGADKSLARPTFQCVLFDGENISFDASLVVYINSSSSITGLE